MKFELKDCGGCRTCQIACSYRLSGDFNYHASAIEITEKEDKNGYIVTLHNGEGEPYRCDGCKDLDEPMCINYCHIKEDLRELVNRYKEECLSKNQPKGDAKNE
jgi:Fe-S-cluster-containing hydrogenase component 2